MHLAYRTPLGEFEWPYARVALAQTFTGWTLDYIDSLPYHEVVTIMGVLAGQDQHRQLKQAQAQAKGRAARPARRR